MAASPLYAESRKIVFFGDSLTAGYGLPEEDSFPSLIQERLKTQGKNWTVINAGVSGDTTTGALRRVNWVLRSKPDAVFVALGANDGLRGQDVELMKKNLKSIIRQIRKSGSKVFMAGMMMPTNYGPAYSKAFKTAFGEVAKEEKVPIYPFLLDGVAMNPKLNLGDGLHPNEEGQKIVADRVYRFLDPLLWTK